MKCIKYSIGNRKACSSHFLACLKEIAFIVESLLTEPFKGKLGTAQYCKIDNIDVAAKTGTARKSSSGGKGYTNKLVTSIIGFLPASNPQVEIYVVIDSPSKGALWGSTVAAPVFREVALQTARIMNITPDKFSNKNKKG